MTYDEALQALHTARGASWQFGDQSIHDGIVQAIEVFKRMKMDLDECEDHLMELGEHDGMDQS